MPSDNCGAIACQELLAASTGQEILNNGGNAVDAAVSAAFVQGVVNPMMCGIGGTARLLFYNKEDGSTIFVGSRDVAGEKAEPELFKLTGENFFANTWIVEGFENQVGYKANIVPTMVRALGGAHERFGRLPWKDLLKPAIEYALNGFEVYPWLAELWDPKDERFSEETVPRFSDDTVSMKVKLTSNPECERIYLKEGRTYKVGEVLKQEDYGKALQRIAEKGPDEFYRGDIARVMIADFEKNDGLITMDDLQKTDVRFWQPAIGSYRGYKILTDQLLSIGPFEIEALHILEQLNFDGIEWQSASYHDLMARAFQAMYADEWKYLTMPKYADFPFEQITSKERLRPIAERLQRGGKVTALGKKRNLHSSTTSVSVVDCEGNAACITHSCGSSSGVVTPGLGFLHNNHMDTFDPRPGHVNSVKAGAHPRGTRVSPVMMFRDGRLRMVSSGMSRFKPTAELHAIVSMIMYGIDVQRAVNQPRSHAEYEEDVLYVEETMPVELQSELKKLGWKIVEPPFMPQIPLATIAIDESGQIHPTIDHRGRGGVNPLNNS